MDSQYSAACENVRLSCRKWMEGDNWKADGRRSVDIHKEKLPDLANQILAKKKDNPTWIEWDEENWHYTGQNFDGSEEERKERVALYILALDAINFCFWPCRNYPQDTQINSLEYDHLALALKELAELDDKNHAAANSYAFSPTNMAAMTEEKMTSLLEGRLGSHYLDNIETRSRLWKEVGEVLMRSFNGSAAELLSRADGSAPQLVELVYSHFPGFRDDVTFDSSRILFLKRAQIFVGDVNAALKLNMSGMERLTTFADYRVPQILRHFDVLEYSPSLSNSVDTGTEIPKGSADEISIRAATVTAVDDLVAFLNSHWSDPDDSSPFTAVNVDWYLWQVGERMHRESLLARFHKVRTHFY